MTWKLTAIVSGGQRGADRGALQAAIDLDLGWGGWAPAGWRAEDGEIPLIYRERMKCTTSSDYGMRTRLNVQDSDGTLIVSFAEKLTGGSEFTQKTCERTNKSHLHLVLPERGKTKIPDEVRAGVLEWIEKARISVLNVAGPRESKEPGLQQAVRDALVWILEDHIVEVVDQWRIDGSPDGRHVIALVDVDGAPDV
jgi:putative molybdenum carrier protein